MKAKKKTIWDEKKFMIPAIAIIALILAVSFLITPPEMIKVNEEKQIIDTSNTDVATQPGITPESAAGLYASKIYISRTGVGGDISYSNFEYNISRINSTVSEVMVKFDRITKYVQYTLMQHMQQYLTVEKKGVEWVVTNSPPARIIGTVREYK